MFSSKRIFGWPDNLKDAHIIIIGIANALDLTERLLPGLRAQSIRPVHIAFPPYSKDQITQIIKSRITSTSKENAGAAIDDMAVQFCARKVLSFLASSVLCFYVKFQTKIPNLS